MLFKYGFFLTCASVAAATGAIGAMGVGIPLATAGATIAALTGVGVATAPCLGGDMVGIAGGGAGAGVEEAAVAETAGVAAPPPVEPVALCPPMLPYPPCSPGIIKPKNAFLLLTTKTYFSLTDCLQISLPPEFHRVLRLCVLIVVPPSPLGLAVPLVNDAVQSHEVPVSAPSPSPAAAAAVACGGGGAASHQGSQLAVKGRGVVHHPKIHKKVKKKFLFLGS